MAGETGATPPDVTWLEALASTPHAFGFVSVLRRLECLHRDRPRLGQATRASDAPVRLAQQASLDFAPATLTSFRPGSGDVPHRLEVAFLGLFGPNGPLPIHLTEYARERQRNFGDPTFLQFANIFHHRILELFYRAWAAPRPTVSLDRPDSDRFGVYVASLLGIGMPELRNRDALPDMAKLHYAGHFACQARHPDGLRDMVQDFFALPARVEETVGEWLALPLEGRCRLGESATTGTLGQTVVIGSEVWSRQHKFRLVLGPLGYPDYLRFLPIGGSLAGLAAMVRNYAGDQFSWDLNLVLRREEVPTARLGKLGHLGWTTWLYSSEQKADADDLKLRANRYV